MSLDVTLYIKVDVGTEQLYTVELFSSNITHNLGKMAAEAAIYECLWRPEEVKCFYAKDLIIKLEAALIKLKNYPLEFKQFNPSNGWGSYDIFVTWTEKYLKACKKYPKALIEVSR